MPLTLLLDLDDTLLDTNLGQFVPAYFHALGEHLRPWVDPSLMLPALAAGTELMRANADPRRTLEQVFDSYFYPRIGIPRSPINDAIEGFYDEVFPRLRSLTTPRPGAPELVAWARSQGFLVAVATDPLLPRKAVLERIRWAGLDPAGFDLISTYETFHFSKSHPAYYAEVLGRLGWPEGAVLMVGNDEERDLTCAQEFGLAAYRALAGAPAVAQPQAGHARTGMVGEGTLADLRLWLETADLVALEPALRDRAAIVPILNSSPAVLQGMLGALTPQEWIREPGPDEWAAIEIVGHLRDTEREVHRSQITTLLEERQPFVPRPEAAVWAKQRHYLDQDGVQALAEFADARLDTLGTLRVQPEHVWHKKARHAIFGPTSFQEVVGFMADHDRLHIQQAWRTVRGAA